MTRPNDRATATPSSEALRRELEHARERNDHLGAASVLRRLGVRSACERRLDDALALLADGIAEWRLAGRSKRADQIGGALLSDQGAVFAELGTFDEAQPVLDAALELCDRVGDDGRAATVLGTLGFIAHSRGAFGDALRFIELELERQRRPGARVSATGKAITYNNYAALLHDLGETERAAEFYREAYRRHRELGETHRAIVALVNEATLHAEEGRPDAAEDASRRAVKEAHEEGEVAIEAAALNHLGSLLLERADRLKDGNAAIRRAIELAGSVDDNVGVAIGKLNLAEGLQLSGDLPAAAQALHDVAGEFESLGVREGQVQALAQLAKVLRRAGQPSVASDAAERAIELIEDTRAELHPARIPGRMRELQRAFFADRLDVYDEHCLHLVRQALNADSPGDAKGLRERAFAIGERRRARELSDLIADTEQASALPMGSDMAGARRLLDRRTALIAYVTGADAGACFVVSASDAAVFELPSRARLRRWVDGLRTWCDSESRPPAMFASELSGAVLARALEWIRGLAEPVDRLVVVPDGPLHALPFACLPVAAHADQPLIEAFEIEFALSVAVRLQLQARRDQAKDARGFLAFGDPLMVQARSREAEERAGEAVPDQQGAGYRALAGARAELAKLAEIMRTHGFAPVEVLVRERCTKQAAIAHLDRPQHVWGYLHFATHGVLDLDRPQLSGLLFSPVADTDPYWRAAEIMRRRIVARLVIASACETARGRDVAGEGALGLSRAFLIAGAASVCASLWPIPDDASSELMQRLYEGIAHGQEPAAALREAQLSLLRSTFAHPVNWAAFMLIS